METIHCFQKTRHLQTSLFISLYRALSLRSPFFYQKLFADLFVLFPNYLLIPQKHKCTHFAHKAGASAKRQLHRRVKSVTECKLLSRLMPRYVELHENLVVVSIYRDTGPKVFPKYSAPWIQRTLSVAEKITGGH